MPVISEYWLLPPRRRRPVDGAQPRRGASQAAAIRGCVDRLREAWQARGPADARRACGGIPAAGWAAKQEADTAHRRLDRQAAQAAPQEEAALLAAGLVWSEGHAALGSHAADLAQGVAAPAPLRACADSAQAFEEPFCFSMSDRRMGRAGAVAEHSGENMIPLSCSQAGALCFQMCVF